MNHIKTLKYLDRVLNAYDKHGIMSAPLKFLQYNIKNAPHKLYKFRACTDINFDNLENENIFLTQASKFSDELDILLLFDSMDNISHKQMIKLYKKECLSNYIDNYYSKYKNVDDFDISPQEVKEILKRAYDSNFNFIPNKIKRIVFKRSKVLAKREVSSSAFKSKSKKNYQYKKYLRIYLENRIKMAIKLDDVFSKYGQAEKLANKCKEHYSAKLENIKKGAREASHVHSLCADYKNLSMWEKYADYHKGFCIEYTLDMRKAIDAFMDNQNEINMIESLYNLFKVKYIDCNEKSGKLSSYKFLSALFDDSFKEYAPRYHNPKALSLYAYQKLIKRKDFEFENEWRIVLFNQKNQVIHFPLTSAIFIGRDVSKKDYDKLIAISKKLNIPAYKQKLNHSNNTYDYVLTKGDKS